MQSIAFPDFLSSTSTKVILDHEATVSNLKALLLSDKMSLFGDPYFGTSLKKLMYEQNNQLIKDLVIDDIFIAIQTFMPQIRVERKGIVVNADRTRVYIDIKALNLLDYQVDLYSIELTNSEER